jgi:hypothetical protein
VDESTGEPWSFNVHKPVSVKLPISDAMAAIPGSATPQEFAQRFYSEQGGKIKANVQICQQLAQCLCKQHCPHVALIQHRQAQPSDSMRTAQRLARVLYSEQVARDSHCSSSDCTGTVNSDAGTGSKHRGGEGGGYKPGTGHRGKLPWQNNTCIVWARFECAHQEWVDLICMHQLFL